MSTERKGEYRKSAAWLKGMELTVAVYELMRTFPQEEKFGLVNQLRRASVSVPSNIAEGKGRLSRGKLLHFWGIARGSALEVQTQIEIADALGYTSSQHSDHAYRLAEEVVRILNASIKTIRSSTV